MISYRRMYTRYARHWDKMRMYYQKGVIEKPENYEQMMWSQLEVRVRDAMKLKDMEDETYHSLLTKFYKRYPDAKYTIPSNAPGHVGKLARNPAIVFVEKQKKLMDDGYSANKAFEIVEEEMAKVFDKQREENRILRGFALNNRARSYLNYSQQLAEVEGRAKVQQLDRDLNKYVKQEQKWEDLVYGSLEENQKHLIENRGGMLSEKFKNLTYTQETAEEYFSQYLQTSKLKEPVPPRDYEPALYEIVKDPKAMKDTESLVDLQKGFVRRTENLLKSHRHRSTITDGLKGLSDREILQRMREVPTKIKRDTKSLLKKLDKFNVKLNDDGSVDYSQVPYEHVVKALKKIDTLVRTALMQRDLEFEYPQHAEKIKIKADILRMANAEEDKLQRLQNSLKMIKTGDTGEKLEAGELLREQQEAELNYEQYFGVFTSNDVKNIRESPQKRRLSMKEEPEKLIFENDIAERSQMFTEDPLEREMRLKEIWIDLKRKNAIGGPDARTTNEQLELQELIVDKIRDVRWKIDQEMVKNSLDPLFKKAYSRYTKDEFLFDADIQFSKLKAFLEKNPRILREDPVIGQEYLGIIGLIRRKKLLEYTAPAYSREHEETFEEQKEHMEAKSRERRRKLIEFQTEMERLTLEADGGEEDVIEESKKEAVKRKGSENDTLLRQFQQATKKS